MKKTPKMKQMQFGFMKNIKPSKEYTKRVTRSYRNEKQTMRDKEYKQLTYDYYND